MEDTGNGVWVENEVQLLTWGPSAFPISRSEQAQASLGPPEHVTGELKDTKPASSAQRLPLASSCEHQDGGKCREVSWPHPLGQSHFLRSLEYASCSRNK